MTNDLKLEDPTEPSNQSDTSSIASRSSSAAQPPCAQPSPRDQPGGSKGVLIIDAVSMVYNISMKKGKARPDWDISRQESGSFLCVCTWDGTQVQECAISKKEAKLKAFTRLLELYDGSATNVEGQGDSSMKTTPVASAISKLHEESVKNELKPPRFDLKEGRTEPVEFHCVCIFDGFTAEATAPNKKVAKENAAQCVLELWEEQSTHA